MTQGERIRLIRKELNLTLEKFGEKLGVQRSAVSKIERGERGLTEQMVKAICREFNVNYDYLVDGDGEMFDDLPETIMDELCLQYSLDEFDRAIVEMYIGLPESARMAVKSEITKMIKKLGRWKGDEEDT